MHPRRQVEKVLYSKKDGVVGYDKGAQGNGHLGVKVPWQWSTWTGNPVWREEQPKYTQRPTVAHSD